MDAVSLIIGQTVPWSASWSAEERFEIRPCKYAGNRLAVWQPFKPGEGRPIFAKPHNVRQRKSIAEMRCTVCGEKTVMGNRWWWPRGNQQGRWWMTTEAPVHSPCADLAIMHCPELRKSGHPPMLFPECHTVLFAIVGGEQFERDFGISTGGRDVVGSLKLAWEVSLHTEKPWFLEDI